MVPLNHIFNEIIAMRVTRKQLEDLKAPKDQIYSFVRFELEGVEITEDLCVKYAQIFNWMWAADNLLKKEARRKYIRIISPTRTKRLRIINLALTKYIKSNTNLGWRRYKNAIEPNRVEYNLACARAFYRATQVG